MNYTCHGVLLKLFLEYSMLNCQTVASFDQIRGFMNGNIVLCASLSLWFLSVLPFPRFLFFLRQQLHEWCSCFSLSSFSIARSIF